MLELRNQTGFCALAGTLPRKHMKGYQIETSVGLEYYSNKIDAFKTLVHNIYFDKFFLPIHLLEEMEEKGLKGTGTVRKNRTMKYPLLDNSTMVKERYLMNILFQRRKFNCLQME